ncbi:MAG: hypothetical protein KDA50_12695 [Rhodobacteraceae bacterium]|nr:hypothetical protein [Paracoccaceae bacterium]
MRTTLIGGIFFLIPVVFLIYILAKAYQISHQFAGKLAGLMPVDSIAGLAVVNILAVVLIIVVCFLAGLAARLAFFRRHVDKIETVLIEFFPGYAIAKSMASGVAGQSDVDSLLKTVLVAFDDHEAIGFEVERSDTRVIVFLPGAPSAWSGSSVAVPPDRVTPLRLPVHQASGLLRTLGRGTTAALLPAEATAGPKD